MLTKKPPESSHLWTEVGSSASGEHAFPPGYPSSTPPYLPQRPRTAPASSDRARANALLEDSDAARNTSNLLDELSGERVWRVGGIGVFAYAEDVRDERIRQAAWREWMENNGESEWLQATRARTAAYTRAHGEGRMRPLVRWHLVEAQDAFPPDALPVGHEENGAVLYSARTWMGGGVHIGKYVHFVSIVGLTLADARCGTHLPGRNCFAYSGEECQAPFFEVLCGPPEVVEWVTFERGATANLPGWQPVEGGRDGLDQRAMLVARAAHKGCV